MLRRGRLLSSWRLGLRAFAADAGATTDWDDFNNVAKELSRIAREQGIRHAVPDTKTLKELGHNDLIMAIRKKHGGFVAVAGKMGFNVEKPDLAIQKKITSRENRRRKRQIRVEKHDFY